VPLAGSTPVLRGRQNFRVNFGCQLWQSTLGSLLQTTQFLPAPLRAGLGVGVGSCPLRGLPAVFPPRSIHFPFCLKAVCTAGAESLLALLAAGFPVGKLGGGTSGHAGVVPCPQRRHAAGANPAPPQPFSPASTFFCNCLGSSVSENHNEGKFEFEQSNRHAQKKRKKKNDLEKKSPKVLSPATQREMEIKVATACTRQRCDM